MMHIYICIELEPAKERCPIVFQGHPSNFKVTRYKTSPILTQIGRFRTIGRSQLSNSSDLPCSRLPTTEETSRYITALRVSLQWRHNGRDGVSNHQPHDYLLNRLFMRRSTKTWKLCVTGLCAGNSPLTGEFPAQKRVTGKIFPFHHVIMKRCHFIIAVVVFLHA